MDVDSFLARIQAATHYADQIVHVEELPARGASFGGLTEPLAPALQAALAEIGVERFYTHQAAAIDAIRRGEDVIVTAGTASGKTLAYNVPVLEQALREPMARALYLFPTKALAQDQLRGLDALTDTSALSSLIYGTYDGDTPRSERSALRQSANVILSNPDMLHLAILPNHQNWRTFFRNLVFVVIDEAHVYRGVFGSHVGCVLRRLRRVCSLYGADPVFIFCSATIGNPAEHARRLCARSVTVIGDDGAPHGPRRFVLWNPALKDAALGIRRSPNTEASELMADLVGQGIRHIVFVQSRRVAELILRYTREALRKEGPDLIDAISAYRAGYLPQRRREIERRLFGGDLLGVTATSALELGIDVGDLDAIVMVGYPGTVASMWQQAGRAGRGSEEALALMIGHDNPLDQYWMQHPRQLFGHAPESALTDPGNRYVLSAHLTCAAYEQPLTEADEELFGSRLPSLREALVAKGDLERRGRRWYYPHRDYPAELVNLRSMEGDPYQLIKEGDGREVLEEIDGATAFLRIYPGAIHLYQGESYRITRLDIKGRRAYAQSTDVGYYTQPLELNQVRIIRSLLARQLDEADVFFGRLRARQHVIGFQRQEQFTGTVLSREELDLPPTVFETQGLWFEVPSVVNETLSREGLDFAGGLHAVEHACIAMLPSLAMCDRRDLGGVSTPRHMDTDRAQIFIYDGYPGGVGLAEQGYRHIEIVWQRALDAVEQCPCAEGCPSCIHSPYCGNNNQPLDKRAAIHILRFLLGND